MIYPSSHETSVEFNATALSGGEFML